jgi:hypothetical protein
MARRVVIGVVVFLLVFGGLRACRYFAPGAAAKRQLRSMVKDFEQERLLGVMSAVSRRYDDHLGFDYESLGGVVSETISTYDDLEVDLIITGVEAADAEVRIGIQFIVWGSVEGSRGYLVGSLTDPCTATLLFREETPGWRWASTLQLDIPELRDELESRRRR